MRRFSSPTAVASGLLLTALLLTGCGSDKAKDTTAETTVAVAETTAAAPEAAAETVAAETAAAETAAVETVAAAATDTTVAASVAAPAGELTAAFVTQMLLGMTGSTEADPADVKCISEKVSEADLSSLIKAGADAQSSPAMKAIVKAAFQCKPKGLADNFVKDTFKDLPAGVTDEQKSCLANKVFEIIASDDSVIDAMLKADAKMPEALKSKFTKVAEDCVPAGPARDALLKDLLKD